MTHQEPDLSTVECSRCRARLASSPSVAGSMAVSTYTPGVDIKRNYALCGACSLPFMEFLTPDLVYDQTFQVLKATLQETWA